MGEERRRYLMASAFPVGSSAAIDFTAGEMTLLRALIAGPPTLNRHPLSREFCRGIAPLCGCLSCSCGTAAGAATPLRSFRP